MKRKIKFFFENLKNLKNLTKINCTRYKVMKGASYSGNGPEKARDAFCSKY